ncbi:hypothetical protein BJY59DRAFT_158 [Rhodotorula toruloides]
MQGASAPRRLLPPIPPTLHSLAHLQPNGSEPFCKAFNTLSRLLRLTQAAPTDPPPHPSRPSLSRSPPLSRDTMAPPGRPNQFSTAEYDWFFERLMKGYNFDEVAEEFNIVFAPEGSGRKQVTKETIRHAWDAQMKKPSFKYYSQSGPQGSLPQASFHRHQKGQGGECRRQREERVRRRGVPRHARGTRPRGLCLLLCRACLDLPLHRLDVDGLGSLDHFLCPARDHHQPRRRLGNRHLRPGSRARGAGEGGRIEGEQGGQVCAHRCWVEAHECLRSGLDGAPGAVYPVLRGEPRAEGFRRELDRHDEEEEAGRGQAGRRRGGVPLNDD